MNKKNILNINVVICLIAHSIVMPLSAGNTPGKSVVRQLNQPAPAAAARPAQAWTKQTQGAGVPAHAISAAAVTSVVKAIDTKDLLFNIQEGVEEEHESAAVEVTVSAAGEVVIKSARTVEINLANADKPLLKSRRSLLMAAQRKKWAEQEKKFTKEHDARLAEEKKRALAVQAVVKKELDELELLPLDGAPPAPL